MGPLVVDAGRLLAGERLDRGHDLVGDLAAGAAERDAVAAAGEVERLAERMVTRAILGNRAPTGWILSVSLSPTGTTGTPAVSARWATPVRPR